jgi:hypothetical protein
MPDWLQAFAKTQRGGVARLKAASPDRQQAGSITGMQADSITGFK